MADIANDCHMEEDTSGVEIRVLEGAKGKGLFATKNYQEGDIIFEEWPLVCSQFPWNATCGYRACDFCLRSLESAEENVRRLLHKPDIVLPHPECCITDKSLHCECEECGVQYCSAQCKEAAFSQHHATLCLHSREREGNHPLEQLNEAWKQMYYPPETSGIMLFARILAIVNQAKEKSAVLHQFSEFCHHTVNEDAQLAHKLMGENFSQRLDVLREMLAQTLGTPDTQHWLTREGFHSLVAMVGTNGQGVGTSPLAEWAKRVGKLEGLPEVEKKNLDAFVDQLYEDIEEETAGFLNCEGSALYSLQSKSNHSCVPNAEISFLHANSRLSLKATRPVASGEEICISYLEQCGLTQSRHSRQKELRENYMFVCDCPKCEAEADDPDVTSEEEISSGEDED